MSNFAHIPTAWRRLTESAIEAEQQVYAAPRYAAMLCRTSLEEWVRWMYEHDGDLVMPYDDNLSQLIHQDSFQALVAPIHFKHLNLIRKLGNAAVHSNAKIKPEEALHALQLLHGFIKWVVGVYSDEPNTIPTFDPSLVPQKQGTDKTKEELQALENKYQASLDALEKLEAELATWKASKESNIAFVPPPIDPNESLTRKIYIDSLLREAGWDPNGLNVSEYPVTNCMPQANGYNGDGKVDYVLWGNNGLPLALVEAKRTTRDPREGQHQAKCYADCLQKAFGQRPVIFYTNGFDMWIWDDTDYPPRSVHGYYTKDELQTLVNRRSLRKPLAHEPINQDITDRYYQNEAIRAVNETLERKNRKALLVMATGTGKTRVSAAIVDLLSKANWIKRVLFLADRNALVHQAKVNYNDYLPNMPSVDLTKEKEDESSRIVFSTYQTIINQIDGERDGDNRYYSVGHFDLIIFDEIHRSVYNKYKHIFHYFDGFRLGLTATPKTEADKDTYALFDLQKGDPTHAYELDQAVADQFLVPPVPIPVLSKFQRQGIKYADLTEEEKLAYEEEFADPITGEFPDEIDASALNQWLFNIDTVDKVIGQLMKVGIKVESGDKLGKTIIFARSHDHARFIEERFNIQYPEYKGEFLKVIDYKEAYRYDLLNRFKVKDKMPQIAVSVDMLDTGIDVPEVTNLVFFKPVRSSAKFWQMIGRGTRLCKDLLEYGRDKENFFIFDFCENFEFFGQNPKGFEATNSKSLSQRLFELRIRLAQVLRMEQDESIKAYAEELIQFVAKQTQALNPDSFIVRQHLRVVEKYRDANAWNHLSDLDIREIFEHIAPLISETDEDELAKRFDAIMLDMQLYTILSDRRYVKLMDQVKGIARKLTKKASIPAVQSKMDILRDIQHPEYWEDMGIIGLERVRIELRDIIKFLEREDRPKVYTDFTDDIEINSGEIAVNFRSNDLDVYRQRVHRYFEQNQHILIIQKLKTNIPITAAELNELENKLFGQGLLGTKAQFVEAFGEQPLGRFIRSILGLDANAAKTAFASFLSEKSMNAQQIRFVDAIINSFIVNGIVDPGKLFEPPFTDINDSGIVGLFDQADSARIIRMIEQVNRNAEAG